MIDPVRSRRRPGYLSRVSGRTAELSADHQTPERRQNAHAHGQKLGLATRDGSKYSGQSHLYRAGTVQLSAARRSPSRVRRRSTDCGRSRPGDAIVRRANGSGATRPRLSAVELFEKAQLQLQRNAANACKMYQPTSGRYLLRTLVKCGECGLGMVGIRQLSTCKKYEYLYYACTGYAPLTIGRTTKCPPSLSAGGAA